MYPLACVAMLLAVVPRSSILQMVLNIWQTHMDLPCHVEVIVNTGNKLLFGETNPASDLEF